jgi:hypothetical protein
MFKKNFLYPLLALLALISKVKIPTQGCNSVAREVKVVEREAVSAVAAEKEAARQAEAALERAAAAARQAAAEREAYATAQKEATHRVILSSPKSTTFATLEKNENSLLNNDDIIVNTNTTITLKNKIGDKLFIETVSLNRILEVHEVILLNRRLNHIKMQILINNSQSANNSDLIFGLKSNTSIDTEISTALDDLKFVKTYVYYPLSGTLTLKLSVESLFGSQETEIDVKVS